MQLVPIVNSRDAIGKLVINIHRLLKGRGYSSLILNEKRRFGPYRRGLKNELIEGWASIGLEEPEIAIYHHSIGTRVADHFLNLPSRRKVVIYHGITPPEHLAPSQREASELGLRQIRDLAKRADKTLVFSRFSSVEFESHASIKAIELPYYLPNRREVFAIGARKPRVLIVGRIVRHKRVIEGIRALMVAKNERPDLSVVVVGSLKADPQYSGELVRFIAEAGVGDWVTLKGRISEWSLRRLYRKSLLWLSLSAHEGFCVPAIEALRAGLRVVAFKGTALEETVGEAGELVSSTDAGRVGEAILRSLGGESTREVNQHLERFAPERFEGGFLDAIR